MDHPLIDLINAKIAKAEAEGAFDNLPGVGHPLPSRDPSQEAVLNRVLQDNGAVPAFVALSQELARLREDLTTTSDRTRRRALLIDIALTEERLACARKV
ncbi:MAG: DUF1992 domain-containing protein [Primorskyibacter sp.]